MKSESEDMSRTLAWACGMVLQSGPDDRRRIALAYQEAQELIAGIPKDNGDANPRIVACFKRSDTYRADDDVACVGWILTAIQERVNERDLPDWRQFRKIINRTVKLLPLPSPTVH
ncbi:hypothetical protein GOL96_31500 [Sinorhizobium medicae]|uniref:hypothetical protein n=1 Tax=Sinorhizobium medicae TaxID=110321 RepID=UPI0003796744|nr:hypothetical protein [Sinorhizobium medicae]MDX0931568.1 hypothetical protein [Sinorhizobium medicae]MDX1195547.1 hypothetical protein [Sinorhizobium medicae]MDX1238205.1 hypothetical protein [Sinorhizobium medicae]